jgi:succinyl-diaminopimelate desuccinylase
MDFSQEAERYRKEFSKLLTEWVNIESVYNEGSIEKYKPFGKGVAEALQWFVNLGKKDGFLTKNVDGYAAHVEYGQCSEYVYAFGHCDVVPVGDGWYQDPFKLLKIGDKLIGRGVTDDKGPALAAYLALKLLKDNNIPLKRRVRVVVGGNEENGFKCIRHYFKNEPAPAFGFVPDAKFPVINGEMGAVTINISGNIDNKDLTVKGGEAHNTIPGYVTIKGCSMNESEKQLLKENNIELQNIEEGFKLVGLSGHSSKPEKANNPIEKMFKLFSKIPKQKWTENLYGVFDGSNVHGELFDLNKSGRCGKLILVPTIIDIENGRLNMTLSVRYPEVLTAEEITTTIREYFKRFEMDDYDVSSFNNKNPSYIEENSAIVKTLYNIYLKHTGDTVNKIRVTSAGTYAALMENSVVFGGEFPDGSSGNTHMANEYGSEDAFIKSIGMYAEAFYELSNL